MRLLFVCTTDVNKKTYGGSQCTNRNYLSFCEILGRENVSVINLTSEINKSLSSRITKWSNYLKGYSEGLSKKIIKNIIELSRQHDFIFIDSSEYGVLNYYLKKDNDKNIIINFFHNVEYNIRIQKLASNPLSFWRLLICYYNEKRAFKYSDKIVALNKRDSNEIQRIYGNLKRHKVIITPISLPDSLCKDETNIPEQLTSTPPTCIFIGHHWYANIHGIKWFIANVLDQVNIKLQIIGNGMDIVQNEFKHPKIEFLGFVPDISCYIKNADYVIVPIFKGAGMKVKTCEALMYGKNIIGTTEAFEGYDIEYAKVGAVCNNRQEFIDTINYLNSAKAKKFNSYSRNYFLEKYSFSATLINFRDILFN